MINKRILAIAAGVAGVLFLGVLFFVVFQTFFSGSGTITVWTIQGNEQAVKEVATLYRQKHKGYKVKIVPVPEQVYEFTSLFALASQKGTNDRPAPDVWIMPNEWLTQHRDKLESAPDGTLDKAVQTTFTKGSASTLAKGRSNADIIKQDYAKIAEQDVIANGNVYGIPLNMDTLALYYDRTKINPAPKTWDEVAELTKRFTLEANGMVSRSTIALGDSTSVKHGIDILSILMLQHGVDMVDAATNVATFNISETGSRPPGTQALDYFASFGKPGNPNYTWQRNFGSSLTALKNGKTLMAVGYLNDMASLGSLGQTNIGVAPLPQVDVGNPQTYGRYLAATVTKQASQTADGRNEKKLQAAWDFVALFAHPAVSDTYAKSLRVVPARKDVAKKQTFGEYYEAFIAQVPYAVTWNKDEVAVADGALKEALTLAIDNKQDSQVALDVAAKGYTSFLQRDRGINADETVMNFWMSEEDTTIYTETTRDYLRKNKDVKRVAISHRNPARYEWEILNAMAARKGPDLLSIPSDSVFRYSPLLRSLPLRGFNKSTRLSDLETLQRTYVSSVLTDNYIDGKLYGMPVHTETLMIAYNTELHGKIRRAWQSAQARISQSEDPFSSPILWDDLKNLSKITREVMPGVGYIALGTGSNVEHSEDIYAAILKQYGGEMTDPDRNVTGIHLPVSSRQSIVPGAEAEKLVRGFADSSNGYSSWSASSPNSIEALADGRVAAAFVYPRDLKKVTDRNPLISLNYIPLPQLRSTSDPVDFSSSYSLTIPRPTRDPVNAFNYILLAVFKGAENDSLISPIKGSRTTTVLERRRGSNVQSMQRNTAESYYKGAYPKEIDQAIIDFLDRKRTLDQTASVFNQLLRKSLVN